MGFFYIQRKPPHSPVGTAPAGLFVVMEAPSMGLTPPIRNSMALSGDCVGLHLFY